MSYFRSAVKNSHCLLLLLPSLLAFTTKRLGGSINCRHRGTIFDNLKIKISQTRPTHFDIFKHLQYSISGYLELIALCSDNMECFRAYFKKLGVIKNVLMTSHIYCVTNKLYKKTNILTIHIDVITVLLQ